MTGHEAVPGILTQQEMDELAKRKTGDKRGTAAKAAMTLLFGAACYLGGLTANGEEEGEELAAPEAPYENFSQDAIQVNTGLHAEQSSHSVNPGIARAASVMIAEVCAKEEAGYIPESFATGGLFVNGTGLSVGTVAHAVVSSVLPSYGQDCFIQATVVTGNDTAPVEMLFEHEAFSFVPDLTEASVEEVADAAVFVPVPEWAELVMHPSIESGDLTPLRYGSGVPEQAVTILSDVPAYDDVQVSEHYTIAGYEIMEDVGLRKQFVVTEGMVCSGMSGSPLLKVSKGQAQPVAVGVISTSNKNVDSNCGTDGVASFFAK